MVSVPARAHIPERRRPLNQDTGTVIYYIRAGEDFPFRWTILYN